MKWKLQEVLFPIVMHFFVKLHLEQEKKCRAGLELSIGNWLDHWIAVVCNWCDLM